MDFQCSTDDDRSHLSSTLEMVRKEKQNDKTQIEGEKGDSRHIRNGDRGRKTEHVHVILQL